MPPLIRLRHTPFIFIAAKDCWRMLPIFAECFAAPYANDLPPLVLFHHFAAAALRFVFAMLFAMLSFAAAFADAADAPFAEPPLRLCRHAIPLIITPRHCRRDDCSLFRHDILLHFLITFRCRHADYECRFAAPLFRRRCRCCRHYCFSLFAFAAFFSFTLRHMLFFFFFFFLFAADAIRCCFSRFR